MKQNEDIIFVADDNEDFIDFDEYDTIHQSRHLTEDSDIDAYFANGWSLSLDHDFWRNDSEGFGRRLYRTFPTRYRLKDFVLSKSLRRVLKKNSDLKVIIRPLRISPRKSALYEKHYVRYGEKSWATLARKYPYPSKRLPKEMEVCVFKNRQLVACSIFLVTEKSVQSNSAFWDLNQPNRSLGILTVLLEMQYAIRKRKDFYYLGAYYKQNPNFQYKTRFPGLEFYDWDNNRWIDKANANELLDQKLKRLEVLPPFDYEFFYTLLPNPAAHTFQDILGIALIGSRARGTERTDSDVDLLILTTDMAQHFENPDLVSNRWGSFRYARREKWFSGETIRAFYREENLQIEYNFVKPEWANLPANEEAIRIVKDGMKILYDPSGVLEKLQEAILI